MAEGLVGRTLLRGEYELQEVLGRGGMATVYRAYSRSLDTDVAVKVLAPRLASDTGFRERFRDEARSLAALHHPNLIEVHHYGEEGDLVYIVMRLVPGGTLKDRLQSVDGPVDLITTARLIGQVADALQHAHDHGLVHLDIKPANILLGRADWPLLADFGITRALGRQATDAGRERIAGTPLYMSPEQCLGGPIDGRSDQYSLAITTYELLTGLRPFHAPTTEGLLQQHVHQPPPRPRELNPGLPGPVEDVLLRGLAKVPDQRFPTIRDFAAALTSAVERTRGVTLETKAALAGVVPNLLAILVLILLGPLMIGLLPGGALVGGRMPISWPFQFLLAAAIAALLLGIRWHVVGLLTRAVSWALGGLDRLSREYIASGAASATPSRGANWRNAVAGSVEGAVDLVYLFAVYWLISAPALALLGFFAGPTTQLLVTTGGTALVALAALGLVLRMYRVGGPVVAALFLAIGWIGANALPATDVGLGAGFSLAWTVKAALGTAVVALLVATRRTVHPLVRRLAAAASSQLVAEMQAGVLPEEQRARRHHVEALAVTISDFFYLLAGYAVLRRPAIDGLQVLVGQVPAAILVTGVAGILWALLIVRLHALAGPTGLGLGLLLGAPLLVSLPVLEERILGATWPVTVATWAVGTLLILLIAAVRGQVQTIGQRALGQRLDHALLGAASASSEEQAERRVSALGGVVGALIDVVFLVIGYWVVGVPAAEALTHASGRSGFGSLILILLLLATIVVLFGPMRRAAVVLSDTGGSAWAARSRMLSSLVVVMAVLLVSSCAATPAVMAVPQVAGGLTLDPPQSPLVLVDWEYWLPWTPSQEHATYNLALSCSDGRSLGQFREAVRLGQGGAMPSGSVGSLGRTGVSCDDWRSVYFGHRGNAGLPDQSSVSWDWLDVQIVVDADGAIDVVEKHRVIFTYGAHRSLVWRRTVPSEVGPASNLEVWEGGQRYPLASEGEDLPRAMRIEEEGSQQRVRWWFPEINSPTERTFTIRYRLEGGSRTSGPIRRLELPIIGPDRPEPVWRGTVAVELPQDYPVQHAVLSSIGASSRHGLLNGRVPWFEARDVPPDVGWTIVVEVPSSLTATVTPEPTSTPELTLTPSPQTPSPTTEPSRTPTPSQAGLAAEVVTPTPRPASATRTPTPRPPTATATPSRTPTLVPTATLTATPEPACAGDERMSFGPANPSMGQEFVIAVTSRKAHTDVRLTGPENASGPSIRQTGDGYVWEWRARAGSSGRKDYNFYVQGSTLCTTNFTVVSDPPSPPPPPTNTPTLAPTATPTITPTPVCAAGDAMTFSPPNPGPEESFIVRIASIQRYEDGTFRLEGPDIDTVHTFPPAQDGNTWYYDWLATVTSDGVKEYFFIVSEQVCASNSFEVTPVPTPTIAF